MTPAARQTSGAVILFARRRAPASSPRLVHPRLLDGFEDFFAATPVIVVEARQFLDPAHQVDEIHPGRIDIRARLGQSDGNLADIRPFHRFLSLTMLIE
jgi:hypothetical protein